jgi:hypothetical protein
MNSIIKYHFLIPVLILFFLSGCEKNIESVYFEEKQPIDVSDVKTFNKKFQGKYIHSGNSSILEITKDKLIQSYFVHLHFHRNGIDSSFRGNKNNNNEVISALAKMNMTGRIVEDSIFAIWEIRV